MVGSNQNILGEIALFEELAAKTLELAIEKFTVFFWLLASVFAYIAFFALFTLSVRRIVLNLADIFRDLMNGEVFKNPD